uniref:L-glutamate gamma-semialdehyde dehydrogenase n=1 Tax=Meleagris gallopavo TaxID=9103 RepID=G1N005_MELGA
MLGRLLCSLSWRWVMLRLEASPLCNSLCSACRGTWCCGSLATRPCFPATLSTRSCWKLGSLPTSSSSCQQMDPCLVMLSPALSTSAGSTSPAACRKSGWGSTRSCFNQKPRSERGRGTFAECSLLWVLRSARCFDIQVLFLTDISSICRTSLLWGWPDGFVEGVTARSGPCHTFPMFPTPPPFSPRTFKRLWKQASENLDRYRTFPRLAGECGGKNFHLVHSSADVSSVVNGTLRSAFEYGGQKCSACSRLYAPRSLWPQIKAKLLEETKKIKVGDPVQDFGTFFSAVIDDKSFARIKKWLEHAKTSPNLSILAGGGCDDSVGYFVEPCIVESQDPTDPIMKEEIFGPILTVYVYPEERYQEVLELIDTTTPYGLTGAVFAQERSIIEEARSRLRNAAGNFYINDKSTGAVVSQQPFGGSRISGTNDKPGGPHYILRWTSPQAIKETHVPLSDWRYAYMQ